MAGGLIVAAAAGKLICGFGAGRHANRMAVGIGMIPRGEVGLIFAELGRASGIFSNEVYAGMVIVIALTTLLPPLVMKWFYARHGYLLSSG